MTSRDGSRRQTSPFPLAADPPIGVQGKRIPTRLVRSAPSGKPTFFASLAAQPGHRLNAGGTVAQEGYPGSGSAPELQLPLRYDESSNARNDFGTVDVQQQTDAPNRLDLPVKECH